MQDFTAGGLSGPTPRTLSCGDPAFDKRVKELVRDWGCEIAPELIEQLIMTALKMARDHIGVADLKMTTRSLNELRYAARTFAPYRATRKVCVFGSAARRRTRPSSSPPRNSRARCASTDTW